MREYKFRAWDKVHNKMIEWEQYKDEIVSSDFWDKDLVVMEYTGLQDKNGKDIYTGDIYIDRELIKSGEWVEDIYEVCFYEGAYQIKGKITSSYRGENYSEVRLYDIKTINQRNMECIGNIFENKELL